MQEMSLSNHNGGDAHEGWWAATSFPAPFQPAHGGALGEQSRTRAHISVASGAVQSVELTADDGAVTIHSMPQSAEASQPQ